MSEGKLVLNKVNEEFTKKVRKKVLWSRMEILELHQNICSKHGDSVRAKNLALFKNVCEDVN